MTTTNKDEKIQIRIAAKDKKWLKEYVSKKNLTMSKVFVDFVEWLKNKEASK